MAIADDAVVGMSRKSSRAASLDASAALHNGLLPEKKSLVARKAAMLIIAGTYSNAVDVQKVPEFSVVSLTLIRQMVNELKNISLNDNVAKTFSDEWKISCVGGFTAATAPELTTGEAIARPEGPISELRLTLAERKVQWMMCASLEMLKDRASGKLGRGKQGTWYKTADRLYGADARSSHKAVDKRVKSGHAGVAPKPAGKAPDIPKCIVDKLVEFIGMLRAFKSPVCARARARAALSRRASAAPRKPPRVPHARPSSAPRAAPSRST